MELYIADIKGVTPQMASLISPQRAQRAMRCKKPDDRKRCIAGGLLIKRFLGDTAIYENEYGKPFAENGAFFSLSHSGEYVALAVSDFPVGCDIQQTEYIKPESTGRIVFCENEMSLIKNARDKSGAFYELWTKKESLLKCIGEGFHRPPKSVDVSGNVFTENGKSYYFKRWSFSDYAICICSTENDFPEYPEFTEI